MSVVLRDKSKPPAEREVPKARKRHRGRKPWAIEVRYPTLASLELGWLRYQRYRTRARAIQALRTNQKKARSAEYRLSGPDGEVIT